MNQKLLSIVICLMLFATLSMTAIFNYENTSLEEFIVANEESSRALFEGVDWWPMLGHDIEHSRYSTSTAPETNILNWTYQTNGDVESSPAVFDDRIYIGSNDDNVYCLNAENGNEIWNFTTGGDVKSSPAVVNGKVYVGSKDDKVYCLNAENGNETWNFTTGGDVLSSPAVFDDRVYIGSNDDNVYCLNASNGIKFWNYRTGGAVQSSPAVADGKVYIGESIVGGNVYCLNAENGSKIWNYTTNHIVTGSPLVYEDKLFICSLYCTIYCLDALNGSELWSFQVNGFRESSPAIYQDNIYVVLGNNTLYCLYAANGSERWAYEIGSGSISSPAIADGKLFIGADVYNPPFYHGCIYCLDAITSAEIWTYQTNGNIHSSPAIANGKVYIGSNDNKVYCFGEETETNQPPTKPARPIGPVEGEVDIEYTFATTTTDPDSDQISYWFDWGDGNNSGWINTSIASHSWAAEADYEIKAKAKDVYDAESEWSNPSTIHIVEQTTEEPEPKGWIFGSVYDAEGGPIEAASICVQISDIKKECTATNGEGHYQIYVETGDYSVEVNKEGFKKQTITVTVLENQAYNLDFTLVEPGETQTPDENIIAIENAISLGNVGGTVTFIEEEEEIFYTTSLYITEIDLLVTEITEDKISLIVSASETVPGNTIIIQIGEEILPSDDFEITLDGESIPEADNITDILYAHDDGPFAESYILEDPNGGKLIFLSLSHYSEHTITISSLAEAIVSITAVILYVVISAIVLFLFFSPMLANLLHIQRHSRKKK